MSRTAWFFLLILKPLLPDSRLLSIMKGSMIPRFAKKDFDGGVLRGVRGVMISLGHMPPLFYALFGESRAAIRIVRPRRDLDPGETGIIFTMLLGVFAFLIVLILPVAVLLRSLLSMRGLSEELFRACLILACFSFALVAGIVFSFASQVAGIAVFLLLSALICYLLFQERSSALT